MVQKTVEISFDGIKNWFAKMQDWLKNFFEHLTDYEKIAVGAIGLGFLLLIVGILLSAGVF